MAVLSCASLNLDFMRRHPPARTLPGMTAGGNVRRGASMPAIDEEREGGDSDLWEGITTPSGRYMDDLFRGLYKGKASDWQRSCHADFVR